MCMCNFSGLKVFPHSLHFENDNFSPLYGIKEILVDYEVPLMIFNLVWYLVDNLLKTKLFCLTWSYFPAKIANCQACRDSTFALTLISLMISTQVKIYITNFFISFDLFVQSGLGLLA